MSAGLAAATVALGAGAAVPASEQQCLDAFRADTARIEREFMARRRAAGLDRPARSAAEAAARQPQEQALARDLHAALARAADVAEACSRAARQAVGR